MAKAFQKGLAETYHHKHNLPQSELWNSCMIIIWPFLEHLLRFVDGLSEGHQKEMWNSLLQRVRVLLETTVQEDQKFAMKHEDPAEILVALSDKRRQEKGSNNENAIVDMENNGDNKNETNQKKGCNEGGTNGRIFPRRK